MGPVTASNMAADASTTADEAACPAVDCAWKIQLLIQVGSFHQNVENIKHSLTSI